MRSYLLLSLFSLAGLFGNCPLAHGQAAAAAAQVPQLHRILIGNDIQASIDLARSPDKTSPLLIKGVPALGGPDFPKALQSFYGLPITDANWKKLGAAIVDYMQHHDRPVENVTLPPQFADDFRQGVLRIVVEVGHYSQLKFKGNGYFSRSLMFHELGIHPGDEIRYSVLDSAVNWVNTNPYRHVMVLMNMINSAPGTADLDVAVVDRVPLRVAFIYDDTGNQILGNNHYTASFQYANLWGLDHQINYQFTTTDDIRKLQSHSFEYKAPLPWRNYVDLSFGYSKANGELDLDGATFFVPGKEYLGDLRYIVPLSWKGWSLEASAGIDYKQLNNSLFFLSAGAPISSEFLALNTVSSVAQFTFAQSGIRRDAHGAWGFANTLFVSPGGFNDRNTDLRYNSTGFAPGTGLGQAPRVGSRARYLYDGLQVQRLTDLPYGFQFFDHAVGQLSSTNLLGSELMSIGGQATVRGYDERIESGDEGIFASHEIRSPEWRQHLGFLRPKAAPLQTRFLAFLDYGRVRPHILERDQDAPNPSLLSTGVGVRASLSNHFSLNADYGWQLFRPANLVTRGHSRGDITLLLAY